MIRDGRLTIAPSQPHREMEKILASQRRTQETLELTSQHLKATQEQLDANQKQINDLTTKMKTFQATQTNHNGRHQTLDDSVELQTVEAVKRYIEASWNTESIISLPSSFKNDQNVDVFQIDGLLCVKLNNESKILVTIEAKNRRLDSSMINKRWKKMNRFEESLRDSKFIEWNSELSPYQTCSVKHFIGGTYVTQYAKEFAQSKGFGVIIPNGSDYDIAAKSTFDSELL